MPPDSLLALGILLVAVLPGAIYTWAFEREAGLYGVTLADRVLRFVAGSTIMHLILAWPEYLVYRLAIEGRDRLLAGQFAVLWLGMLVLSALPAAAGTILGELYATRTSRLTWPKLRRWLTANQERRLLRILLGRDPAPRAWDDLFSEQLQCYLRVRTTGDSWLAGKFAGDSYAGGYPNEPDLLLEEAYEIDQESGILGRGLGYPLYIASGQIAWIEVVWPSDDNRNGRNEQVGPTDDAPVDASK